MPNEVVRLKSIPLWSNPGPWSREDLARRRRAARRAFDRGFRLQVFSEDELVFPSFPKCEQPGILVSNLQRNGWRAFTGVDISSAKRPGNAIVTVVVDPANRRYLGDVRFGRWRSRAFADQIEDVVKVWRPVVVMVENNGVQQMMIDWIADCKARYSFWTILEGTTTTARTKYDAEAGLPGLEVEFSNGAWTFPLSEYDGIDPADEVEEEPIQLHGREAFRRLADEFRFYPCYRTTDGVMGTLFARQGIEIFRGVGGDENDGLGSIRRR
jgi:hypothetical protein